MVNNCSTEKNKELERHDRRNCPASRVELAGNGVFTSARWVVISTHLCRNGRVIITVMVIGHLFGRLMDDYYKRARCYVNI